jgi:hypothetical protein
MSSIIESHSHSDQDDRIKMQDNPADRNLSNCHSITFYDKDQFCEILSLKG